MQLCITLLHDLFPPAPFKASVVSAEWGYCRSVCDLTSAMKMSVLLSGVFQLLLISLDLRLPVLPAVPALRPANSPAKEPLPAGFISVRPCGELWG